jgi:hypothetical protein
VFTDIGLMVSTRFTSMGDDVIACSDVFYVCGALPWQVWDGEIVFRREHRGDEVGQCSVSGSA